MKSACTSFDELSITSSPRTVITSIPGACLHSSACITPARDSSLFTNEPALPQTTGEDFFPPPVASINPSKMDAASPSAASPPEKLRGSDCSGSTGTACAPGGDTGLHELYFPSQYTQRDTRPKDQGLKRTFRDAIVQDCSRPPARSERCSVTDGASVSAPGRTLGYSTSPWERPLRIKRGRKLSQGEPASEEPRFSWSIIFLFSSRGQVRVCFVKLLAIEHRSSEDGCCTICCCAPGGALGRATTSFGNPRGTDGLSGRGALAKGYAFEEPGFPSTFFFSRAETQPVSIETRPQFVPSSFSPCCTHQAIILFRKR